MSLPTSRNTTYAPGSQVKSDDLNDLQDQFVDLTGGTFDADIELAEDRNLILSGDGKVRHGVELTPLGATAGREVPGGATLNYSTMQWEPTNPGDTVMFPCPIPIGVRALGIEVIGDITAGAGDRIARLRKQAAADGGNSTVASFTATAGTGWTTYTFTFGTPHILSSGGTYFIEYVIGNASDRLAGINIIWDRPPP